MHGLIGHELNENPSPNDTTTKYKTTMYHTNSHNKSAPPGPARPPEQALHRLRQLLSGQLLSLDQVLVEDGRPADGLGGVVDDSVQTTVLALHVPASQPANQLAIQPVSQSVRESVRVSEWVSWWVVGCYKIPPDKCSDSFHDPEVQAIYLQAVLPVTEVSLLGISFWTNTKRKAKECKRQECNHANLNPQ